MRSHEAALLYSHPSSPVILAFSAVCKHGIGESTDLEEHNVRHDVVGLAP